MKIEINGNDVKKIFLGTKPLKSVYLGSKKLFPSLEIPMPYFSGEHVTYGDSSKGRMDIFTSGTLTVPQKMLCDVFLSGAGAGGCGQFGGGSGYTENIKAKELEGEYSVLIGAGGKPTSSPNKVNAGGNTVFENVTARGGEGLIPGSGHPGWGGSGGGLSGIFKNNRYTLSYKGGSDGSSGSGSASGRGQGKTTRAFADPLFPLFAGGGGGGGGARYKGSVEGGLGGGGKGSFDAANARPGNESTGSGGGGEPSASKRLGRAAMGAGGIVSIRWGY